MPAILLLISNTLKLYIYDKLQSIREKWKIKKKLIEYDKTSINQRYEQCS